MFFKSKKNAAEYDAQTAIYFLRTALVIQSALYKEYGREDLAVEIEYRGLSESQHPKFDEVPVANRPYVFITNTEREDKQETEVYRLNVDAINITFPSIAFNPTGSNEHWCVQALCDDIVTRSVVIANDRTSERMLMRLISTINALI